MCRQIARYFEQRIAEKEYARTESICGGADADIGRELNLREGNIRAIEKRHEVDRAHQRDQPEHGLVRGNAMQLFNAMVDGSSVHDVSPVSLLFYWLCSRALPCRRL